MAGTTTTTGSELLVRTYTQDKHFIPFAQLATPYYTEMEKFDDEAPLGVGRYFDIWLADSHASGSVAESGDLPTTGAPTVVQGSVAAIQTTAAFGLSELFMEASRNGGSIGLDAINRHVQMTTRDLMFEMNRQLVAGHGTGLIGTVQTTTSSATTFVASNPLHVLQLREGRKIAFFDTDTGGSIQGAVETVTAINFETRTVTIGNARSLTAGWGFYPALSSTVTGYGIAMNGLRGIADNGTLVTTKFGLTLATYPALNSTVISAGGGTQPWSEALVRKAAHRSTLVAGSQIDEIWTNYGILGEHFNQTVPDRIYDAGTGPDVPTYNIGYKKLPGININGKFVPYRIDGVFPGREMVLINKGLFRKHELRAPSWVGDDTGRGGSSSPVMMQQPGASTGNYALAKVAGQVAMTNQACKMPKALVRITEIADAEICGD